jgi:hypothetical protein
MMSKGHGVHYVVAHVDTKIKVTKIKIIINIKNEIVRTAFTIDHCIRHRWFNRSFENSVFDATCVTSTDFVSYTFPISIHDLQIIIIYYSCINMYTWQIYISRLPIVWNQTYILIDISNCVKYFIWNNVTWNMGLL